MNEQLLTAATVAETAISNLEQEHQQQQKQQPQQHQQPQQQHVDENEPKKKKEIRVWCDGCYDLVHFGHANALRQAKALGDKVIVGIHSDEEITKQKRPPVFTQEERAKMVKGIKWVDEVVLSVPYVTTLEVLDKNNCDFCVHGDDITMNAEGLDTYHLVKSAKRYKEVCRTAGVSTTDLVNRMLLLNRYQYGNEKECATETENSSNLVQDFNAKSPWTGNNQFLLTTQKIIQFSDNKPPKPGDKIVYVAGAFDLFHVGHLDFLEKAKEQGDYLIVGLHSDSCVKSYSNDNNYAIMQLNERVLGVLACKYVNEVVFGAPLSITEDLLEHLKIDVVCHGQTSISFGDGKIDPYAIPKEKGIFKYIDSGNSMTTERIVERIVSHRLEYERCNIKKEFKEIEAFNELQRLDQRQKAG